MDRGYAIRRAAPEDASSLAALSIEVWLNTYATEGVLPAYGEHVISTFTRASFLDQLNDRHTMLIVCEKQGALLGYAKLLLDSRPPNPACGRTELATLYVRRHHQRLGIGAALFNQVAAAGRAAGAASLFLTVNHTNAAAIAFYRSNGMRYEGDWIYEFQDIRTPNHVYVLPLS